MKVQREKVNSRTLYENGKGCGTPTRHYAGRAVERIRQPTAQGCSTCRIFPGDGRDDVFDRAISNVAPIPDHQYFLKIMKLAW
jgi:hypothetical protein